MLDIKWIRSNPEVVQQAADRKGIEFSTAELLEIDERRREQMIRTESLRQERNVLARTAAEAGTRSDEAEMARIKARSREVSSELQQLEERLADTEAEFKRLMLLVPNIPSEDTPIGRSDADNVEVRRVSAPTSFTFQPLDHIELGEALGLIDVARGVKVAGTRNYYLKGNGLHLHRAVQQLAVDLLDERGFTVMDVPLMVKEETLLGTGFFPLGREQTYHLADEGKWLVGTSEAALVSYYSGELVDVREPIRLAAVSNCFRREVGSSGRDVRGLYRVHQFAKVEQVVLCRGEAAESERMMQEITRNAEDLLAMLELPYRVVAVCTGDMGQKNYKQFDIETWMPSRQSYGETHSSSNLHDFQARRANIRYKDENGETRFCHTLNNTAAASPRILIPLLENHQREDGSIYIPPALRKYMNGLAELKPQ